MMSSPPTNQYSKLHETLTKMPPSLVAPPDDKAGVKPPPDNDDRRRHPPPKQQQPDVESRLHPSSLPPLPSNEVTAGSPAPQSYSAHSVSSSSASSPAAASARTSDDKSFARVFFGSSKQKLRKSFLLKRNLKLHDGGDDDEDSDGSADSLRDPLNLPSVILKRREGDGEGLRFNHPPLTQADSEKTFDVDYTNLERNFYRRVVREEVKPKWDDDEEDEEEDEEEEKKPPPHSQQQQEGPSIQLETLQQHVMRQRGQEGSTEFRQGSLLPEAHVAAPAVTWAPAPSTKITHQQQRQRQQQQQRQGDDDSSWHHDGMHTKAREESSAELQRFRPQDNERQYHRREETYEGHRVQEQRPQHRVDGLHRDYNLRQQQQQQQQQPQRYPGSLRNLTTYQPSTTTTMDWEEESLMDDILRATDARGRNGEVLSRNEVLEEMGLIPPRARDNSENDGHPRQFARQQQQQQQYHEPSRWQEPQKPPPHEQARRQEQQQSQQQHELQPGNRTSKLQSIPDDETWFQEVLITSHKQECSPDIIKHLIESVSRECKEDEPIPSSLQQQEDNFFQDRNSIDTWMDDVRRSSNVCPVVLQELMEARSACGSSSGSAHHTSSDTSRNNIYPTKPKQPSTVIQDTRGPVPTDDMLAESLMSHEGSESTGSRIIGDDVLLVSRKNRENQSDDIPSDILEAMGISDDSLVKDIGVKRQDGKSKISSPQRSVTGDEITAEDVLAQIGPDVDYESIPDDVLAALGISKRQLRKAESIDVKNTYFKSGNDGNCPSAKASSVNDRNFVSSSREQRDKYCERSSPDDDVSWVEDVLHLSKRVDPAPTRAYCDSSHTDSMTSSQREIATDEHGPIPEADMLEEAFSGSSRTGSHTGSWRSLREVGHKDNCKGNDSSEEGDRRNLETCLGQSSREGDYDLRGAIIEMKPSLGFLRHRHARHGIYGSGLDCGDSSTNDLELEAMKKRSEVLASIEQCRSKLKRNQQERQQNYD
ncbi:hypothetical protein ACHAW6_004028 [Cyclotella cf. meneghiniana]